MQMSFFSDRLYPSRSGFFCLFFLGFCLQYGLLRFIAFCQQIFSSAFPKINITNCQTFKYFDLERTWWRSFQKRVVRTKFDIYVFISRTNDYLTSICQTIECWTCDCRTNDCRTTYVILHDEVCSIQLYIIMSVTCDMVVVFTVYSRVSFTVGLMTLGVITIVMAMTYDMVLVFSM